MEKTFDLSLISREQLVEELRKRHDICFFAGIQHNTNRSGEVFFRSKGKSLELKGLVYLSDMYVGAALVHILFCEPNPHSEGE